MCKNSTCNWKFAIEAFLEGYHVSETHPQALSIYWGYKLPI